MTDQVASGTVQGAAAGYKATGSWYGALAGAIIGAVGGVFGNRAQKYRRKATGEELRRASQIQAIQRRQIVRSAFIARSQALAAAAAQESGALQSSASQGVLSSIGQQAITNLKFFDAQVGSQVLERYYIKK